MPGKLPYKRAPMWAAYLTTVLFSISAVCGNRAAKLLGGTEANFWRLGVAGLLLGCWAHLRGAGLSGVALPVFVISGVIGFGFGDLAFFQALPRLGSRLSVLLTLCLSSPVAGLVEWAWLGTGLTRAEIVLGLVILAGVALALAPGHRAGLAPRQLGWGLVFGCLAATCQALGAVLSRKAFRLATEAGENVDGITAAYQRVLAGIAVAGIFVLVVKRGSILDSFLQARNGDAPDMQAGRWRPAWSWVLANGVAGPALGVSCYQWALKSTPTGVVLPIVAMTPLVIIPFSYYLEGERPTVRSLAGGALAVAGAAGLAWAAAHH